MRSALLNPRRSRGTGGPSVRSGLEPFRAKAAGAANCMGEAPMPRLPRLVHILIRTLLVLFAAGVTPGCEEPTDPSLEPEVESPVAATSPATVPGSAASALRAGEAPPTPPAPRTPAEYRKAAEAGDVTSMLLLGRSHESLGQKAEARKWYSRAAQAGNDEGKQALAQLDAPATVPSASTSTSTTGAVAGSSPADKGPSTRRVTVAPIPPGEPGKLRWIDIAAVLNYDDMVSDTRVVPPDPKQAAAGGKTRFAGVTTSRDGGLTVAAMGNNEGELTEVTAVIRVRNRVDPGSSPRVAQAGAVAARVTGDNVNQREFLEWVTQYLQTEQRSAPIFRNGWTLIVSGSAAEGRRDPKPHLGTAVMIEMKK